MAACFQIWRRWFRIAALNHFQICCVWVNEEVVPHSGMSLFIRCCPPKGAIGAVPMGATRAATNEKGEEVVPHSGMAVEGCFRLWLDCNVGAPRGIAHCILRKSRRSTHKLEQRTWVYF